MAGKPRSASSERTLVAEQPPRSATAPAQAGAGAGGGDHHNASVTDWIAVVGGALGALMATLDISITNSALPQIQGEIGATGTEGTWISTGYLMSEIVMIPLAAWLTRGKLDNELTISARSTKILTAGKGILARFTKVFALYRQQPRQAYHSPAQRTECHR